jgi:hypothetical protein
MQSFLFIFRRTTTAEHRARLPIRIALLVWSLAALGGPVHAWTPPAQARLVSEAVRMMPKSLRSLMKVHERHLLRGMQSPGSPEDRPEHWQHPDRDYGTAAERAERDARRLIAAVDSHESFDEVIRRFGALAHWVADVNDPLHAADRDPALALYYADYQRYVEEQIPRFRLVFGGYRSDMLTADGPGAYLLASATRSREYATAVRRSYGPDGSRLSAEAFDERSLAFGVGSLSYSHAVTDITRIWIWAWEVCNGDVDGTPFPLDPDPDKPAARPNASPDREDPSP